MLYKWLLTKAYADTGLLVNNFILGTLVPNHEIALCANICKKKIII